VSVEPLPPPDEAEDALLHSEQRFRLLVENVQDYAIFMLDSHGRVASWNTGAERIKGWRADEIVGRPFETFYPPELVEQGWPQEELRRARAEGRFEDEGWRVRKDGSRFWANVVITPLLDAEGRLHGYAKVTRDLSERRDREEIMRRSEEHMRLLVGSVRDYAIFMLDPYGTVLTWNAGAEAIFGFRAEEVIGRNFSLFFTPTDVAAGIPARELRSALAQGRFEIEAWRQRSDGSLIWSHAVLTPVRDAEGVHRGFAKVTRDLSERRRLHELEQSSQRMNRFLAMLAHELRNPLAPIRNAVSLMHAMPGIAGPVASVRDIIDRQLGHLVHLVDDLLDVARVTTGKIQLRREPLDLREVARIALEAAQPLAAARHQRLAPEIGTARVPVEGDRTRLVQVLQNLLNNAVRYTPSGGSIHVSVYRAGAHAIAEVSDSGIGIAPAALERIFALFAQEDEARSFAQGGLGIGLSLAREVVEQHGGELTARSEGAGTGSTFTVRLPLGMESGAEASGLQPAVGVAPPSLRILVIDDNRDSTDTMKDVLNLLGNDARGAYGAREGLAAAREFQPHVVLLDLDMPDGDGVAVLPRLRALLDGPAYVAAMTGHGQSDDRSRTLAAGFQRHLIKPVPVEVLQQTLREAAAWCLDAQADPAPDA
jgi:PAS domain S-box-containing protein